MAKKMRTIMNPLDRSTRNDLNYNFGAIDDNFSSIGGNQDDNDQKFDELDGEIVKLKEEDKRIESKVNENRTLIDAMDLDLIMEQGKLAERRGEVAKEQGEVAQSKGNVAKEQGAKAQSQGNKAEQQGNYAEQQGDYAKEKGEETAKATAEIKEAYTDLQAIKNETIDVTQTTKEQGLKTEQQGLKAEQQGNLAEEQGSAAETKGNYAKEKGDEALAQTERVKPILDKADEAIAHATEQGDYAKTVGDKVLQDNEDLQGIKSEAVDATLEAIEATEQSIVATERATNATNETIEATEKTKERTEYLETLLPNIEGWEFKGEWKKEEQYEKHNIVTFNGSTYILFTDVASGSPTNDDGWHMLAQRGVDGEGSVQSVNGLSPDLEGNVNLGALATPDDVSNSKNEAVAEAKAYTDEAIGDVDLSALETKEDAEGKLTEAKEYTDEKFSEIPEVDITHLETKEDAEGKLAEAKKYTKDTVNGFTLPDFVKVLQNNSQTVSKANGKLDEASTSGADSLEVGYKWIKVGNAKGVALSESMFYRGEPGMVVRFEIFYGAEFSEDEVGLHAKPVMKYRVKTPSRGNEVAPGVGIYQWNEGAISTGWIDII